MTISSICNRLLMLCAPVLLAACQSNSNNVRNLALAELDLQDAQVTNALARKLDKADRAIFRTYLLVHLASSASYCGKPLEDAAGNPPRTLGDALQLTRLEDARSKRYAASVRQAQSKAEPTHPSYKLDQAIAERESVLDMQSNLLMRRAENTPEGKAALRSYKARIKQLNQEIVRLKVQIDRLG